MSCMLFSCSSLAQCYDDSKRRKNHHLATSAFQNLSPEERNTAVRDLYGDEEPIIEECPEFVERKLKGLSAELNRMSIGQKKHYLLAVKQEEKRLHRCRQTEKYVTSKGFKLMFLRAELYDAKMAARRLVRYFKEKHNLFGDNNLACKIQQTDLGEEGKKLLYSGLMCYTGATDSFGRPIVVIRRNELADALEVSLVRDTKCLSEAFFYFFQNIIEGNEAAQTKGIAWIGYNLNTATMQPSQVRAVFPACRMFLYGLPIRVVGYHYCYNDMKETFAINLMLAFLPKSIRARHQAHAVKTHYECILRLALYGINSDNLPFTADGEFNSEILKQYLDKKHQSEADLNSRILAGNEPEGDDAVDDETDNTDDESSIEESVAEVREDGIQSIIKSFYRRNTVVLGSFVEPERKKRRNDE